jgi:hypothetical protein
MKVHVIETMFLDFTRDTQLADAGAETAPYVCLCQRELMNQTNCYQYNQIQDCRNGGSEHCVDCVIYQRGRSALQPMSTDLQRMQNAAGTVVYSVSQA